MAVTEHFLGDHTSPQYFELVEKVLQAFKIKCLFLKIHFFDFFLKNMGAMIDEHGERFHQDIAVIEKRCQGKWNPAVLADYWLLVRETPITEYLPSTNERSKKEAFICTK